MDYYVCDYETHKALLGPWSSARVVTWINTSDEPKKYCNMSRYMLSKEGIYPKTKAGNLAILQDIGAFQQCVQSDVLVRCAKCGALIETTVHCDNCGTFEPTRR